MQQQQAVFQGKSRTSVLIAVRTLSLPCSSLLSLPNLIHSHFLPQSPWCQWLFSLSKNTYDHISNLELSFIAWLLLLPCSLFFFIIPRSLLYAFENIILRRVHWLPKVILVTKKKKSLWTPALEKDHHYVLWLHVHNSQENVWGSPWARCLPLIRTRVLWTHKSPSRNHICEMSMQISFQYES